MKIAIFQHAASEPAGYFETVFSEHKIPHEYIRLYETNEVPATGATHFMFMGGPMSVNDEKELPVPERRKGPDPERRETGPVLGICLGAQLIASAFGAKVYPYRQETGWCRLIREPDLPGALFPVPGTVFGIPAPR